MQVILYKNKSPSNKMQKDIEEVSVKNNVKLIENTSIMTLTLTLTLGADELQSNYIYVPDVERYYFISDFTILQGNKYQLTANIDVLQTYYNQLIASDISGIVERQSINAQYDINDPLYTVLQGRQVVTKNFPAGLSTTGSILLTTA